jgi:hypothetical protein
MSSSSFSLACMPSLGRMHQGTQSERDGRAAEWRAVRSGSLQGAMGPGRTNHGSWPALPSAPHLTPGAAGPSGVRGRWGRGSPRLRPCASRWGPTRVGRPPAAATPACSAAAATPRRAAGRAARAWPAQHAGAASAPRTGSGFCWSSGATPQHPTPTRPATPPAACSRRITGWG